jgi:hypothetical protein
MPGRLRRYCYYEVKTGLSAQSCIREAIGQLMEYSFWPGSQQAERMIVVGEPPYDKDAKAYIKRLRKDFSLRIEYQQFDMKFGATHLNVGHRRSTARSCTRPRAFSVSSRCLEYTPALALSASRTAGSR